MLKIAHRGASGREPGNTLAAFEKAIEAGADMVEMDLQLTVDGKVVVFHDKYVDRMTGGSGPLAEKSLPEINKLTIKGGEKIPTLRRVLSELAGRIKINLELCSAGLVEPVNKVLRSALTAGNWSEDDFLISSFLHPQLAKFAGVRSELKLGVNFSGVPAGGVDYLQLLDFAPHSFHLSRRFFDEQFAAELQEVGVKVFVWTGNRPEEIARFKNLPVDGLFSDFPERLQSAEK